MANKNFTGAIEPRNKFIVKPRPNVTEGARVVTVTSVEQWGDRTFILYRYPDGTECADIVGTFRTRVISRAN